LEDEDVFVFVDDEAAEEVALGVDDAEAGGAGEVALAQGVGLADALAEEFGVNLGALAGQEADADFGFGVVEADADEALAVVFDLDDGAIFQVRSGARGARPSRAGNDAEDRAVVNPGVARDGAVGFAGT